MDKLNYQIAKTSIEEILHQFIIYGSLRDLSKFGIKYKDYEYINQDDSFEKYGDYNFSSFEKYYYTSKDKLILTLKLYFYNGKYCNAGLDIYRCPLIKAFGLYKKTWDSKKLNIEYYYDDSESFDKLLNLTIIINDNIILNSSRRYFYKNFSLDWIASNVNELGVDVFNCSTTCIARKYNCKLEEYQIDRVYNFNYLHELLSGFIMGSI